MSTFNELIDFTRSTTGTYLDSVVYGDEVVVNGDFATDSDWIKTGNLTAISNGTATIGETAGNGSIRQEDALITGKSYIVKFDITAVSSASAVLAFRNDEFSSVGSAVISFGNSLSVATYSKVFVATGSIVNFTVGGGNSSLAIDNISVKELTGGQVSGTPLLRTAAINEPRLEYDASGNPLGLLIEQARSNVLAYSENFTSGWSGYVISSTTSAIASPDGAVSGAKLQEDSSGTGGPRFYPNDNAVLTANQAQTFSCFFKAGTSNYAYVTIRHTNQNIAGAEFDLANGTVNSTQDSGNMTVNGSDIRSVGNGWYRCSVTATCSVSTNSGLYLLGLTDGTGILNGGYPFYTLTGKNIYAWGAQVEIGEFLTSYIPTSGSTVTRAQDVSDVPVERFGYNTGKGSIVVYAQSNKPAVSVYAFELSVDSSDRMFSKFQNEEHLRVRVNFADTAVIDAGNIETGSFAKLGARFANNDFAVSIDGNTPVTDTNGAVNLNARELKIGQSLSNSEHLNGHIKSIQYYPKRLSNEELQLLTQPSASPTMNLTFDGQATSTLVEGLHD